MDPPQEDTSGELSHGGRRDSEQAEWSGIMARDQICSLVTGPGTTAGFCSVALCYAGEGQGVLG